MLPLMEAFYSIQGEGFNTGKAAFFIRLGGCDVCCNFCDVKESWNSSLHPTVHVDLIVEEVLKHPAKAIVVTGGEPMLYDLNLLCNKLKALGVELFLETSGSEAISGIWDWICISPKKNSLPLEQNYPLAHELKVVISDEKDFLWAEQNAKHASPDCKLFLQPEWSNRKKILPLIIDYVKNNPQWMISLQTHKFLNIP